MECEWNFFKKISRTKVPISQVDFEKTFTQNKGHLASYDSIPVEWYKKRIYLLFSGGIGSVAALYYLLKSSSNLDITLIFFENSFHPIVNAWRKKCLEYILASTRTWKGQIFFTSPDKIELHSFYSKDFVSSFEDQEIESKLINCKEFFDNFDEKPKKIGWLMSRIADLYDTDDSVFFWGNLINDWKFFQHLSCSLGLKNVSLFSYNHRHYIYAIGQCEIMMEQIHQNYINSTLFFHQGFLMPRFVGDYVCSCSGSSSFENTYYNSNNEEFEQNAHESKMILKNCGKCEKCLIYVNALKRSLS